MEGVLLLLLVDGRLGVPIHVPQDGRLLVAIHVLPSNRLQNCCLMRFPILLLDSMEPMYGKEH